MVHQPQEYRRARGANRDPELCCTPKEVNAMAKVLVLYYSAYGHIERMAQAIAEGARSAAGTEVTPTPKEMRNPTETLGGTGARP